MKKLILLALTTALFSGCATTRTEYVHVGQNWNQLNSLPAGKDVTVGVVSAKETYRVGETMSFTVTSDKPGKLWLVTVGPDDDVSLVYPNELATDNTVVAEVPVHIPSSGAAWDMKASEPLGRNIVLALVTTGDMDRDQVVAILKGESGQQQSKAIVIEQKSPKWGSAKIVVNVSGESR